MSSGEISALSAGVRERDHANERHPYSAVKNRGSLPEIPDTSCNWSV